MTESVATEKEIAVPGRFSRELSAVVGIPILIWIIGFAPDYVYVATTAIVGALALFEFLQFGEKKGYPILKALSVALMLLVLGAFVSPYLSITVAVFAVLIVIPAAYVFAKGEMETALPASAVCVLGVLYVGMLAGALTMLRLDFGSAGPKLVSFLFISVWAADAGAYYVGRNFGKTRLSPRVSPKKTVEGGLGGIVTSLLAAAVMHFTYFTEFPLMHALIAAAILSVTGVIGDLTESLWKRSAAVKDSGTLIPGHGGFLDRTDSILFSAPILYSYWWLLMRDFKFS